MGLSRLLGTAALVVAAMMPGLANAQTFRLGHHHAVGGAADLASCSATGTTPWTPLPANSAKG